MNCVHAYPDSLGRTGSVRLLIRQSGSGARVDRACVKAKGGHFEHNLSQ